MEKIQFGCFGDDFTGSSDAASFIKKSGMRTVLTDGIPSGDALLPDGTEAVVIALKIRTAPVKEAVNMALSAYKWLKAHGANQVYYKYCSTFDSTNQGNIGPVTDAILEKEQVRYTILCPALPINGRVVQGGHIYVDGIPLNQTHMRHHPLTPMTSSYIPKLMERQGSYGCILIPQENLSEPPELLSQRIGKQTTQKHAYLVPDYTCDEDGKKIAAQFHALPFLTGGSGILTELCRYYKKEYVRDDRMRKVEGRTLILAGSCSDATLEQIKDFKEKGGLAIQVSPDQLLGTTNASAETFDGVWNKVQETSGNAVMVYTSEESSLVKKAQAKYGVEQTSQHLERFMAKLAQKAHESGWEKIIVAGGETSGAVTQALGVNLYLIGTEIAPGVPVLCPVNKNNLQIVLKSGNFGQRDFFERAIKVLDEGTAL